MNIVFVIADLAGGGAARVMTTIANRLAGGGHSVTLVSFEESEEEPFYHVDDGVKLVYAPRKDPAVGSDTLNNILHVRRLRKAILQSSPAVVISFLDTVNVRTLLALVGTHIPIVVSERIHPGYWDIGWFWSFLRRATYPRAAALVVQTSEIAEFIRKWRVRNVKVIPNPVKEPAKEDCVAEITSPALLAIGRLREQKRYDLLLQAFAKARRPEDSWTLYIAGEGEEKSALCELARKTGLDGCVVFLGQVKRIGAALHGADAFVLSSSFEGFPCALSEAMAAGLPCLSTDCPSGPADMISHMDNGILVPNGDVEALAEGLRSLMSDAVLRARLGGNAKRIVDKYSEESVMEKWNDLLHSLVGNGLGMDE